MSHMRLRRRTLKLSELKAMIYEKMKTNERKNDLAFFVMMNNMNKMISLLEEAKEAINIHSDNCLNTVSSGQYGRCRLNEWLAEFEKEFGE